MEYTTVRGVQIPKAEIKIIEDTFGAKLVPDEQAALIRELDITLQQYRAEHDNKEPDMVALLTRPGELFKHMTLNIDFLGMKIPGPYQKPAWFSFKRNY